MQTSPLPDDLPCAIQLGGGDGGSVSVRIDW
jgi:hypothetical protein